MVQLWCLYNLHIYCWKGLPCVRLPFKVRFWRDILKRLYKSHLRLLSWTKEVLSSVLFLEIRWSFKPREFWQFLCFAELLRWWIANSPSISQFEKHYIWAYTVQWIIIMSHSSMPSPPSSTLSFSSFASCLHCNEKPIHVFPEKELRGLDPNYHIHVSVGDLYILRIDPQIFLQQNRQTYRGNILITHRDWGLAIPFLGMFVSNFWYCNFAATWTHSSATGPSKLIHNDSTKLSMSRSQLREQIC